MAEIDTGDLIAFGAMAEIYANGVLGVLREQDRRQRQQERKWNQSRAYPSLGNRVLRYRGGSERSILGHLSVMSGPAASELGNPCYSAVPFRPTACHYI
jgi:hypothetical protein